MAICLKGRERGLWNRDKGQVTLHIICYFTLQPCNEIVYKERSSQYTILNVYIIYPICI